MRFGLKAAATLAATVVLSTAATAAFADDVNLTVNPGSRTVSIAPLTEFTTTIPTVESTTLSQDMTVTVTDATGSGAGWTVYSTVDSVNYTGDYMGTLGPQAFAVGANKSLREDVAPGDTTDPANLPIMGDNLAGGDLGLGQTLLVASPASGKGQFTAVFDLNVTVPRNTDPGTYTGVLSTTIVAGNL